MAIDRSLAGCAARVAVATHSAVDEAALAFVRSRQPAAPQHLADRTSAELESASALCDDHGWSAAPQSYHRQPPVLGPDDLTWRRHRNPRHDSISFASGFAPRDFEPGVDRWARHTANGTVRVRLLRRREANRPWVVCLHGFGMSASRFDLTALWAKHFHSNLGYNVAMPVLPLHGSRKSADSQQMLSLDLSVTKHSITQAIWDVRRLIQWIRDADGGPVGVYGLSLGGYLSTLLASVERVDCVVAGIPFADVPALMTHHRAPRSYQSILRSRAAADAFRAVSPLSLTPLVPAHRRALFAGRGDRLIPTDQSIALSEGWSDSPVHWYNGGHTSYLWSRDTKAFVTDFLRTSLADRRI